MLFPIRTVNLSDLTIYHLLKTNDDSNVKEPKDKRSKLSEDTITKENSLLISHSLSETALVTTKDPIDSNIFLVEKTRKDIIVSAYNNFYTAHSNKLNPKFIHYTKKDKNSLFTPTKLPRLLETEKGDDEDDDNDNDPLIYVFFCETPKMLQLFHRNVVNELIPIKSSSADNIVLILDAQSAELYFRLAGLKHDEECFLSVGIFPKGKSLESLALGITDLNINLTCGKELDALKNEFIDSSFVELPFLDEKGIQSIISCINQQSAIQAGPADYRNYKLLDPNEKLFEFFCHEQFQNYITELTGLKVGGIMDFQLIKIDAGSFQIFNDLYNQPIGLDCVISINTVKSDNVHDGAWIYLCEGEEVLKIIPKQGSMSLAYRTEGCQRFLQFVSKQSNLSLYQFHILFKVQSSENDES